MSSKHDGPTITYSCHWCRFCNQTRHVDSEADEEYFEQTCTHPEGPRGTIDANNTPRTCPFILALLKANGNPHAP